MVVEARKSSGPGKPAALFVRMETVALDGKMVPVEETVVSAQAKGRDGAIDAETVGKMAIGAAAGAITGRTLGRDPDSTLAGGAAGAIAGSVTALTTREGPATLPAGAAIDERLDSPLRGNRYSRLWHSPRGRHDGSPGDSDHDQRSRPGRAGISR